MCPVTHASATTPSCTACACSTVAWLDNPARFKRGRGGSDGFGFAPKDDGSYAKVPQTGNVIVEDHCDIGAHTTIDRATLGSTVLKKDASWTTSFRSPTTW